MNIKIKTASSFDKDLKRLTKRYNSLPNDLRKLKLDLLDNPGLGKDLGNGIYKIRLAIKSKKKGESGGGRVIAHHIVFVEVSEHIITLLTIFDKSEKDNITEKEIITLLKKNGII